MLLKLLTQSEFLVLVSRFSSSKPRTFGITYICHHGLARNRREQSICKDFLNGVWIIYFDFSAFLLSDLLTNIFIEWWYLYIWLFFCPAPKVYNTTLDFLHRYYQYLFSISRLSLQVDGKILKRIYKKNSDTFRSLKFYFLAN